MNDQRSTIPVRPLLLAAAMVFACSRPEPPAAPVQQPKTEEHASAAITTDSDRYAMEEGPFGPETTIATTFHAPPDRPVYVENCNGAIGTGLQHLEGSKWVDVWAAERNACLSEPIVIPAGESRTEIIVAASGAHAAVDSRRNDTRIDGGTFRVVWHGLYTSFDLDARPFGPQLPLEQRISAPITIEAPPPVDPSKSSPEERPSEIGWTEPEQGALAAPDTAVRIRIELAPAGITLAGTPHLYLDREWIENPLVTGLDQVPIAAVEMEYAPPQPLRPGTHQARVVYMDDAQAMHWYAWSFEVVE
jgi:hypothetical protein